MACWCMGGLDFIYSFSNTHTHTHILVDNKSWTMNFYNFILVINCILMETIELGQSFN